VRIVQLGDNALGRRIREIVRGDDEVFEAHTRADLRSTIDAVDDIDWLVSAGCRFILRSDELAAAANNCNVHTSLLPWGRGANPNVWALACGEPAGVSIHAMVPEVDTGPVYAQAAVDVHFGDTADVLYRRLEHRAVELFAESWPGIRTGQIRPRPQGPGGSVHRLSDMEDLARIDLASSVTWKQALDVLRALTFPPHRNLIVEDGGRRWHVEIGITEVDD
jgi:methionyl-tRNA formyltransferase